MNAALGRVAPEQAVYRAAFPVPPFHGAISNGADMKRLDLTGQRFGRLVAESIAGPEWLCRCDCGGQTLARAGHLRHGNVTSCGCSRDFDSDIIGKRFGLLTVTGRDSKGYVAQCDCGNTTHVTRRSHLTGGGVRSCGCIRGQSRIRDITGQRFGKLIARSRTHEGEWVCECDCGGTTTVRTDHLTGGRTVSCGCQRVESKRVNTEVNAVGETFGKLTVTEVSWREDRWHSVAWANGTCECGNTFESRLADLKNGTTRTCGCGTHVSGIEEEFVSFLQDLAPVRPQYRIGRRVFDAALPDRNLLFEFNGVYWHSYPRTKRAAHADKRRAAEDLGFRVIYVWEDQWLYRTQQVKDYLERVLLGAKRKIGARQLIPHDVPRTDAVAFHEQFHLQGFKNTISTLHFGLSSKQGELQAVASFSPDGTLHRYTVRSGVSVAGGLPRMVKAFSAATPTASKVITFCDRDHFSGGVYEQAGFQKTGHSLTMSYVQRRRRLRREHFQKHKLPGIFNDVDMSQREIDICAANSIYACWNSGVDRYELSLRT